MPDISALNPYVIMEVVDNATLTDFIRQSYPFREANPRMMICDAFPIMLANFIEDTAEEGAKQVGNE